MQRKMAESAFSSALRAIPFLRSSSGQILTKPFLDVCRSALPVLDKLGPSMAVIRSDISGNIQRLDAVHEADKSVYSTLYEIVRNEAVQGVAKMPSSCTNALLWLTRSMDFTVVLFRKLVDNPDWTMLKVVEDSYSVAFKQWHGWISAAAFKVALKLIPSRKKFMELIVINVDEGHYKVNEDIEAFISSMSPILQEIHIFMQSLRLDRMKSV